MSSQSSFDSWLLDIIRAYYPQDQRASWDHIVHLLRAEPTLSVSTDNYTWENGTSELLLLFQGTVPAVFRGQTYGFPVKIWLPHAYPKAAPVGYVAPTPNMMVKPGQHIDTDGRIYHPYLSAWASGPTAQSTMLGFVAVLKEIFSKSPPAVARPAASRANPAAAPPRPPKFDGSQPAATPPPPSQQTQQPLPPGPPPPPPKEGKEAERADQQTGTAGLPYKWISPESNPPPLPPKPELQSQAAQVHGTGALSDGQRYAQDYRSPPPIPPQDYNSPAPLPSYSQQYKQYPSQFQQYPNHYQHHPLPTQTTHAPPQPPPLSSSGQQQPSSTQFSQHMSASHPTSGFHPNQAGQYATPPDHTHLAPNPAQPTPPTLAQSMDLLSLDLDDNRQTRTHTHSAPPPPPAATPAQPAQSRARQLDAVSHTILASAREYMGETESSLAQLRSYSADLSARQETLEQELAELDRLSALAKSNSADLHRAIEEAHKSTAETSALPLPDVDTLLVGPTVPDAQLYEAAADEAAAAHARAFLYRALDQGKITPGSFVKQSRAVAREEFLAKALARKIAVGLGLDIDVASAPASVAASAPTDSPSSLPAVRSSRAPEGRAGASAIGYSDPSKTSHESASRPGNPPSDRKSQVQPGPAKAAIDADDFHDDIESYYR